MEPMKLTDYLDILSSIIEVHLDAFIEQEFMAEQLVMISKTFKIDPELIKRFYKGGIDHGIVNQIKELQSRPEPELEKLVIDYRRTNTLWLGNPLFQYYEAKFSEFFRANYGSKIFPGYIKLIREFDINKYSNFYVYFTIFTIIIEMIKGSKEKEGQHKKDDKNKSYKGLELLEREIALRSFYFLNIFKAKRFSFLDNKKDWASFDQMGQLINELLLFGELQGNIRMLNFFQEESLLKVFRSIAGGVSKAKGLSKIIPIKDEAKDLILKEAQKNFEKGYPHSHVVMAEELYKLLLSHGDKYCNPNKKGTSILSENEISNLIKDIARTHNRRFGDKGVKKRNN